MSLYAGILSVHTNTRMTSHYAKLFDDAIAKQMDSILNLYDE